MMERLVPLLVLSMAVLSSCGGGGDSTSDFSGTPDELAQQALDAMADAQSYNEAFVIESEPGLPVWEFDYVSPDSYRIWQAVEHTNSSQTCHGSSTSEMACVTVVHEESERFTYEVVAVDDRYFERKCDAARQNCDEWLEEERPPLVLAGPSPTFAPGWPLVAIEMATWQSSGEDDGDYTITGTVNHLRAIFENERRVLTAAGITSFGTECSSGASETPVTIDENPAGDSPAGVENCHDQTFEEMLAGQEPDVSFFDSSPATIEVTIARDGSYVRRVAISAPSPPDHEPDAAVQLVIEYSRFGAVTVDAPR